jgi:hypothetical protein
MNGASPALLKQARTLPVHHIDNLEAAIASDTVDIEVNGDSYSFLAHDVAG